MMALRRISRFRRPRTAEDGTESGGKQAEPVEAKDLPDTGTVAPTPTRGDASPAPEDLKRAVTDAVSDAAPDLGSAGDGLVDDPVTDPTGQGLSPSVGADVLGSVGPDVSPSFDPRLGSVDDAIGEATGRSGLDPDAKTPDEFAHLRPDSGGTAGFVEVVGVGPDPTEQGEDEKSQRDLLAELGFSDDEIDLAFDDPDAFTALVNEKADRAFLEEHGYSEAEIDATLSDPDAFKDSIHLQAEKALAGREESPLDRDSEESIVQGISIFEEMELARDALLANGYSEEEADELTSPPRGSWVLSDFTPKPELQEALDEIATNQQVAEEKEVVSDEKEVVAEEEEVIVSDEEVVVSEEKVVGAEEPEDEGPIETVFIGGGAEDRGDQRITPAEEEKAEEDEAEGEKAEDQEQAIDQDTAGSDSEDTAGSDAESASRPDTEVTDPRIEKQARDLEEELGAGSRDPRSGAVDPSRVEVATGGGDPSRVITTDDLAQPVPEGTDGGGGTKTDNSSESTGLNSIDQVNFGPEGGGDPTEAGLDDDPSVLEIDRDREDPATTGDTGATDKADGSGGPEPDLGPRPAVDLTAPVDLGPATGPITSSSFAVDVEPGPGDDTAEGTDENDLLGSTGRFGTGAVDPGPEGDTIVSTVGPDLDASMPDLDAQRGSEGAPVDALEIAMELPVVEEMSPREADPVFDELDDAKLGDVDIRDIDSDAIETFFNG